MRLKLQSGRVILIERIYCLTLKRIMISKMPAIVRLEAIEMMMNGSSQGILKDQDNKSLHQQGIGIMIIVALKEHSRICSKTTVQDYMI